MLRIIDLLKYEVKGHKFWIKSFFRQVVCPSLLNRLNLDSSLKLTFSKPFSSDVDILKRNSALPLYFSLTVAFELIYVQIILLQRVILLFLHCLASPNSLFHLNFCKWIKWFLFTNIHYFFICLFWSFSGLTCLFSYFGRTFDYKILNNSRHLWRIHQDFWKDSIVFVLRYRNK